MSEIDDTLEILPPARAFEPYRPSALQSLAKARLQDRLADQADRVDLASMTLTELTAWAGDRRVGVWLKDPAFAAWFTDRDDFRHRSVAMKDLGLQVLQDVLTHELVPKVCTMADKLKALDMLFKLTGAYPAKAPGQFLDRDLAAMSEDEIDRQLANARPK